jgi:hypothetical protein
MKTDDLIRALTTDLAPPGPSIETRFAAAFLPGVLIALALFAVTLGPRGDLALVAGDMRFQFKFVVTLLLALCSALLVWRLVRPGAPARLQMAVLAFVPLVLTAGVLTELFVLPTASWCPKLVGSNGLVCLVSIPFFALPMLIAEILALRQALRPGLRLPVWLPVFSPAASLPQSMRRIAPMILRSSLRSGTALASPSWRSWAVSPDAWRCAGEVTAGHSPVMALALATMEAGVA